MLGGFTLSNEGFRLPGLRDLLVDPGIIAPCAPQTLQLSALAHIAIAMSGKEERTMLWGVVFQPASSYNLTILVRYGGGYVHMAITRS